ncbi:hypothetical protein [Phaeobacter sp.]|uniref:hypothetical protein n=1 Tax=Phaeobacter sp. TaxID=1902409 RepID=UPI0025E96F37|nr:hypothetical protein [Phaeobacter sp.]
MTRLSFIALICLVGPAHAFAQTGVDCASATVGLDFDGDSDPQATQFLLGRYGCGAVTLKLKAVLEDDDLELKVQEAFVQTNLGEALSLTFGKAIATYDKSQFFRPLDVVQSDRLNFDIRDTSGALAGLPQVAIAHFGGSATTRFLFSSDFKNEPDGANQGLDQVVMSHAGFAGGADYELVARYAEGNINTFSLGVAASTALNDFALSYGTIIFQRDVRRFDKRAALATAGALGSADDTWFPQFALGVTVNPPFDPSLSLTLEAFHDGTGLTESEWVAIGGGFGPLPYLRQNYLGISAQRSFGIVDGTLSEIYNVDDGSSNIRLGIHFERSGFDVNIVREWSIGETGDEFVSGDMKTILEMRFDL